MIFFFFFFFFSSRRRHTRCLSDWSSDVCSSDLPSMPLHFWNDPGDLRYREAYFEYYKPKGKNVWRHGDYVIIHSKTGGLTFYGRSDAVIKVSGVRVGTSEIYNVVEKMPEVADSLAV